MKLSGKILPMAVSQARMSATEMGSRFFQKNNYLHTHSLDHLKLQHKLFNLNKIPSTISTLPRGKELIGLNITEAHPYHLGTAPVYNPEILQALSPSEMEHWMEMASKYYAQVGKYELLTDVKCLTTTSENGVPLYYVDHALLEPKSYTPLEKLINFATSIFTSSNK